ncbi:GNAT family N-acetyltransferase [Pilimelia columellifera]|uniref:GNAT family N-acetyltransferase n=1 Tax=Pilimelia columellifera subsp. columellifera TaxID=706583 RepID=A0ABN3NP21_9ACTN
MLDATRLRDEYDRQIRAAEGSALAEGMTVETDGPVVRVLYPGRGFVSVPRALRLDDAEMDALIARQRDRFAALGQPVEWKTRSHDLPADLTDRLRAAGFVPEDEETVLVAATVHLAAPTPPPTGVTLREVDTDADFHRIAAMHEQVWHNGRDWLAASLSRRKAASPDNLRILVAEADGDVVSAAWLEFADGVDFAGLWGGSTLAAWRGRGIYRALVARRAQLAADRGAPYLQVDASADSAPILRRLGFVELTRTTPYVWTPPVTA